MAESESGTVPRRDPTELRRWRIAVAAVFSVSGIGLTTWFSRIPQIKDVLGLSNTDLGLLYLPGVIASLIGLSTSAFVLAQLGIRRGLGACAVALSAGVALIGIGTTVFASVPLVIAGAVLFGLGAGTMDVMMNVEGASFEKAARITTMPLFHAFFSIGTVLGAASGVLAEAWSVTVAAHTGIVAIAILAITLTALAWIPPHSVTTSTDTKRGTWAQRVLYAWREPRTYALGLIVLGASFAEGSANDWLALGVVDGHGGTEAIGALGLTLFSVAMTVTRLAGGRLVDRFGRVYVLQVLAVISVAGLLLFILAPNVPLALVGATLWGTGAALAFPLGMSAAADDPAHASARVTATATIGYLAFLCGPPLLGFVADTVGVLGSLFIVVGLVLISLLATPAARPLSPGSPQ